MTSDDLSDYLYALHAPSRNKMIFEKYGKENGSGMSNEEADTLIKELEQKYPKEVLEQGAQMFKDMLAENRQIMLDFGLESQDVIDSWSRTKPTFHCMVLLWMRWMLKQLPTQLVALVYMFMEGQARRLRVERARLPTCLPTSCLHLQH